MDQDSTARLAALEAALVEQSKQIVEQQSQIVDMASRLNQLGEASTSSFAEMLAKEYTAMGSDVVHQTIINGLLARADEATRQYVEASLQIAYEAFSEKISDPAFLEHFGLAARSVFPDIRLEPAAN